MGIYIGQNKYTGGPADPSSSMIPKSIGTTAGDMIYFSGASTPVRLPKGTAGQVLTMNSGATAPIWQTPSGGGGGTTVTLPSNYNASIGLTLNSSTLTTVCTIGGVNLNLKASGSGGSSTLAGLTDTTISSPVNKQALIYDSTNSKWMNSYIIWDQNMHSNEWETASGELNPDGSDQGQPCIVNFNTNSSRRNIWFMGWSGTIIPEANPDGPNGEHFFYLSFNAVVSTDDGPVDHYLVIFNESGEDVILSIERLQCNGSDVDRALVQSINNSYLPALPNGEAAILCYTVGAIPSIGNTVGIVSWGGNFSVQ